jgi:hypothetical protein
VLASLPEGRDVVIAGRNAASVAVARTSLDDMYLRHTGRRYSESQTPGDNEPRDQRELVEASK